MLLKHTDKTFEETLESIQNADKKTWAGLITKFVVRQSVRGIIVTLVKTYCPTNSKAEKAELIIGAWALAGFISGPPSDWAAEQVTDVISFVESALGKSEKSEDVPETDTLNNFNK